MPIRDTREYKTMALMAPVDGEESYIVEGYATTFNQRYTLYEIDGVDYGEIVDGRAFDGADMSDVIMQFDHAGRVFARLSNGTLQLSTDVHGLKIRADLSKTESARQLYEEIKAGMIREMSFAFTVAEDDYNVDTHTRTILRIKKVYDVSAVSIPANPNTDISARSAKSLVDGFIEKEKAERLKADERKRTIQIIKILTMEV